MHELPKQGLLLVCSLRNEAAHLPAGVIFCLWFSRVQSILDINTFAANPCSYQHPSFALHEKQMTNIRTAKYFYSIFIAC